MKFLHYANNPEMTSPLCFFVRITIHYTSYQLKCVLYLNEYWRGDRVILIRVHNFSHPMLK